MCYYRNDRKFTPTGTSCIGNAVGRVQDPRLQELSGFVASHQYPDVFYSIEDSLNDDFVYVIHKNGTLLGKYNVLEYSHLSMVQS